MTSQSRRRCVEPVETDEMILDTMFAVIAIPMGWHDSTQVYDTPSGLVNQNAHSIVLPPLRGLIEPS